MAFNPYASEDFNRIQTKSVKDREQQLKEKEATTNQVDHPLMEGKKLDMSAKELKGFANAMGQKEFRNILGDYVDEISDPQHRPELDQYLRQMEESGDLPPGTELIQPETGFCLKTSVKKLVSERTMKYFDQKCFINVCFHDSVPKAEKTPVRGPDGSTGFNWSLPHRVSKLRNDQDQNKELVSTYDVVYHGDIKSYMVYPDFQKFVADTALDGVGKVLQENKEKVSLDYKIMKNMKCKGGKPALMTIKSKTDNPLIDNVDMDKVQTKLQRDINKIKTDHQEKERKEKEENNAQKKLEDAKNRFTGDDKEEESEEEAEEVKPEGVIPPPYKIVHSFPADMGDAWGGFTTAQMDHDREMRQKVPTHITVTLDLKWIDSIKRAKLDINESTVVFEYPEQYYLDLDLKYKCDPDQGSAKFDKSTRKLVITMPVVGLTEAAQQLVDQHYQKYVVEQQERLKELELQGEVTKSDAKTDDTDGPGQGKDEDPELRQAALDQLQNMASQPGVSSKVLKTSPLLGGDSEVLHDEYNLERDTDYLKQNLFADNDEDDVKGDVGGQGGDVLEKGKKQDFLKVYDESKDGKKAGEQTEESGLLKDGQVRTRREGQVDTGAEVNEDQNQPVIEELSSTVFTDKKTAEQAITETKKLEPEIVFDWDKAERMDAKFQFINQGELIFLNFNFKGYKKDCDVRYALSENEVFLEVRDVPKNKVHRLCKTLFKSIDVQGSDVQLLVDYIIFKLKKSVVKGGDPGDATARWDDVGYDIESFTVPEPSMGTLKSNYFVQKVDPKTQEAADSNKENSSSNISKENQSTAQEKAQEEVVDESKMTEEERVEYHKKKEEEKIQQILDRARTATLSALMPLESDVFAIY